jgi:hypothetical protein
VSNEKESKIRGLYISYDAPNVGSDDNFHFLANQCFVNEGEILSNEIEMSQKDQ